MFAKPNQFDSGKVARREFGSLNTNEQVDEAFEWIKSKNGIATVDCGNDGQFVAMSVELFNRIEDEMLRDAYIPHWELRGFAVEDMPTISNIFWAADETLLMKCVRELLEQAPSPSGNADIQGAVSHTKCLFHSLKSFSYDSCDDAPVVVMPTTVYRNSSDGVGTTATLAVEAFPFSELGKPSPNPIVSGTRYWWSKMLGYKAWFEGLSIHDTHRALAWLVCKLLRDSFVDYGIWFGDLPKEQPSEYVKELTEAANRDLGERMRLLLSKLVPLEELEVITFEVEEELLSDFETICHEQGLTVQNALHIAIIRFVKDPKGVLASCETIA